MYMEKKVEKEAKLKKEFVKEEVIKVVESSEDKISPLIPLLKLGGKAAIAGAVSDDAGVGTKAVIDEVKKIHFLCYKKRTKIRLYIF